MNLLIHTISNKNPNLDTIIEKLNQKSNQNTDTIGNSNSNSSSNISTSSNSNSNSNRTVRALDFDGWNCQAVTK